MRTKTWKTAFRKRLMLVAAISIAIPGQFAVATPALAGQTSPPPGNTNEYWCKLFVTIGDLPANDVGSCNAYGTNGNNYQVYGRGDLTGFVATTCNYLRSVAPDYFYSQWDSIAECVADDAGY